MACKTWIAVKFVLPLSVLLPSVASATNPADRWIVEVNPGHCRLERTFSPPIAAKFSVETNVGSDVYSLSLSNAHFARMPAGLTDSARFKIDGRTHAVTYVAMFPSDDSFKRLANLAGLRGRAIDALSKAREFSIEGRVIRIGPLAMPDAATGFAAFRRCEGEQLIKWGADAAQFAPGGSQPSVKNPFEIIPQSRLRKIRYPKAPISLLHYLLIDEAGVAQRCGSVSGPNATAFEQAICAEVVGRKIAKPALNSKGEPVKGVITFTPARLVSITRNE